jgi:malate dehydrogenase
MIEGVKVRKVTVVGAGKYGSTTAEKIARMDLVDQVVLTDILEGIPQGLALDMNQARPVEKYRTLVVGSNDYADTAGSDVVVITAGSPRKPGMSRMDLLTVNAKVVKAVTEQIMKYSPDAIGFGSAEEQGDGSGGHSRQLAPCPLHQRVGRCRHLRR